MTIKAKAFKEMRRAKGYTQVELAREFDVNVITVSRWERGSIKPIPRLAEIALFSLKSKPNQKGGK
jgi:DNA-binding transcriptional regulator YiaG